MDLYEMSLGNILMDPVASFIKFLKNLHRTDERSYVVCYLIWICMK